MIQVVFILTLLHIQSQICGSIDLNGQIDDKTNTPIIGVLAQEIPRFVDVVWPGAYKSYIAASYVKFIEGGGARVVPIWIDKPRSYYEGIMSKLNGVLFPGGQASFYKSNGYAEAGAYIYDIAKQMNDNGQYFPLFGTCLGFELLIYVSNNNQEFRKLCHSQRTSLPLTFSTDYNDSRIFGSAPDGIINILKTEEVTVNFHSFCATRQKMIQFGLDEEWRMLSFNKDTFGLEFISTIEHKRYPFYGVQYHPEKNQYEWRRHRDIPHSRNAIKSAHYFASFFVNQCRKSDNRFASSDEENQMLIYNFPTTYTGRHNIAYVQSYLFEASTDYPKYQNDFSQFEINDSFQ